VKPSSQPKIQTEIKSEISDEALKPEAKNLISELVDEMRVPLVIELEEAHNQRNLVPKEVEEDKSTTHDENTGKEIKFSSWVVPLSQMKPNVVSQIQNDEATVEEESSVAVEISMEETRDMGNELGDEMEEVKKQIVLTSNEKEEEPKVATENSIEDPESIESMPITCNKSKLEKIKVSNNEEAKSKILELTKKTDSGYKCTVCNYANKVKFSVERHIETHVDGLIYECPSCDKTFATSNTLGVHKSKSCKKRIYVKEWLDASKELTADIKHSLQSDKFVTNTEQVAVQNFEKISNEIKESLEKDNQLFKCKLCFLPTNSQESLELHIETCHLEELEYECNICFQVLATDYALNKHIRRNHDEDKIQEPMEKKRKRTSEIEIDEKLNEREVEEPLVKVASANTSPDFMNPTCDKDVDLLSKDKLQEVSDKIKVSSKEEAQKKTAELIKTVHGGHMCTKFGYISSQKGSIKLHTEIHFEGLELPCKFCDKVFQTRATLAKHRLRHHRGLYIHDD